MVLGIWVRSDEMFRLIVVFIFVFVRIISGFMIFCIVEVVD